MLTQNHPDDERLSALASHDDDAVADASLTSHVDSCDRCAGLVSELGLLRASLAELPDVAPSRPLRLLPPVTEPASGTADRLGGWVRRFFAPALAAGAALAMVGLVGTAAPALDGMGSEAGDGDAALEQVEADSPEQRLSAEDGGEAEEDGGEAAAEPGVLSATDAPRGEGGTDVSRYQDGSDEATEDREARTSPPQQNLPAERSPWPMVLFTGVALVAGTLLLRWILVPRAG
jgi:hypothetical protein